MTFVTHVGPEVVSGPRPISDHMIVGLFQQAWRGTGEMLSPETREIHPVEATQHTVDIVFEGLASAFSRVRAFGRQILG